MAVRQSDGDYELVETVELEQRTQRMYNLTVAGAHTFFVGNEAWLVHNTDCDDVERDALERAVALANRDKHTVATTGIHDVHSGWQDKGGYISGRLGTDRAMQLAAEMGVSFPGGYRFGKLGWFSIDGGVPGQHYASHAEVQMAALMYYGDLPKGIIAVSQDFCKKGSCFSFLNHLAEHSGQEWTVINPAGKWIFRPKGSP